MKLFLYKLISRLGYSVVKRKTQQIQERNKIKDFIHLDRNNVLFQAREDIINLRKHFKDLMIAQDGEGFEISFNDFKFYIESAEDIFIVKEVFGDGDYSFGANTPTVIIDVGMNIGITSVFFSQFDYIEKVYGFEPVPYTYKIATKNIAQNNEADDKCQLFNYGLSDQDGKDIFHFDPSNKGKTGVESFSRRQRGQSYNVEVKLRKASLVLKEIIEEHPEELILVKMDCEGSEYRIFEDLNTSGILKKVNVFFIEWHFHGGESIQDILIANNFNTTMRNLSTKSGLIFAYRS